jgi:hypothetical protein
MRKPVAPINTKDQDPLVFLLSAMAASAAGRRPGAAIEDQEAEGQRSFVGSDTLPTDMSDPYFRDGIARSTLERIGVPIPEGVDKIKSVIPHNLFSAMPKGWLTMAALSHWGTEFHGLVDGDPMFQYVTLPKGWKKVGTDHSMWSNLVDEQGRKRAGIFYKAAFYDRSAHLSLECRFSARYDYDRMANKGEIVGVVKDGEKVIYTTEVRSCSGKDRSDYELTDAATKDATDWLSKNFPEWGDPTAYWD